MRKEEEVKETVAPACVVTVGLPGLRVEPSANSEVVETDGSGLEAQSCLDKK